MNDVIDLSNYIIQYCNKNDIEITISKLHKLLYFIQAEFLITFDKPCFNDELLANPYGPIIDKVIENYLPQCTTINTITKDTTINFTTTLTTNDIKFNLTEKPTIDSVLDEIAHLSNLELRDIIINQPPWRDAYHKDIGEIITNDSMVTFFKE